MSKVKSVGIPAAVVAARDAMDAVDSMRSVLGAQATEIATLFTKQRTAEGIDAELRTLVIAVDRRLQTVAVDLENRRRDQHVWNAQAATVSTALNDRVNAVSESADRAHTYALTADAFAGYMAQKVLDFTGLTFLGRLRWLCTGRVVGMPSSLTHARFNAPAAQTWPHNRVEVNKASRISPAPVYGAASAEAAPMGVQATRPANQKSLRHAGDPCEATAGPMGHVW